MDICVATTTQLVYTANIININSIYTLVENDIMLSLDTWHSVNFTLSK